MLKIVCASLVGLAVSAGVALAACPPGLPASVACGRPDAKLALAGTYALDSDHTAVLTRVSHIGYGHMVFRFERASGELIWDPAKPAASKLSVSVEAASLHTNVKNFASELIGDKYLKTQSFPTATFVSTAFRQTDPLHGKVDGQFTLMGKTQPITFDVKLGGAGQMMGQSRFGIEARAWIKPQDYGLPAMMVDPIELVIDAEFASKPAS